MKEIKHKGFQAVGLAGVFLPATAKHDWLWESEADAALSHPCTYPVVDDRGTQTRPRCRPESSTSSPSCCPVPAAARPANCIYPTDHPPCPQKVLCSDREGATQRGEDVGISGNIPDSSSVKHRQHHTACRLCTHRGQNGKTPTPLSHVPSFSNTDAQHSWKSCSYPPQQIPVSVLIQVW